MSETDFRSPESRSGRFYPLTLGNHWHYHGLLRMQFVPPNETPGSAIEMESDIKCDLVCTEQRDSRDYTVEATVTTMRDRIDYTWVLYRQDASGLYEADVQPVGPPSCAPTTLLAPDRAGPASRGSTDAVAGALAQRMAGAPAARTQAVLAAWSRIRDRVELVRGAAGPAADGRRGPRGPLAGEITRLRYPLGLGARWVIREDPRFTAVVEGVHPVRAGSSWVSAYRIRLGSELYGPNDVVRMWMSRIGPTGFAYHLEANATDESGNVVGLVLADYDERLLDFQLAKPGHDRTAAPEPVAKTGVGD
jgi:hypothetical protein